MRRAVEVGFEGAARREVRDDDDHPGLGLPLAPTPAAAWMLAAALAAAFLRPRIGPPAVLLAWACTAGSAGESRDRPTRPSSW